MRILRAVGVITVVLSVWCRPAKANIWDWFAELSGPGPFRSRGNIMATIYCQGRMPPKDPQSAPNIEKRWFALLPKNDTNVACLYADARMFKSDEDARFFPVRMEVYEAGPTYRLAPPLELGFGVGLIHFDSKGIKANNLTLTFPRLVFKPLLLLPKVNDGKWGFIQIYFRETRIVGELTEANFRPKPGVTFRSVNDLVPSTGFIVDAPAFLRVIGVKR